MRPITPRVLVAVLLSLVPFSAATHARIVSPIPKAGSAADSGPEDATAGFNQKSAPDQSPLTVLDTQPGALPETGASGQIK